MSQLTSRCPSPSVIVIGLLLLGVAVAAVAEEGPRVAPQARRAVQAVPQAKGCESCVLSHQKCFASCFADAGGEKVRTCLTACDKAADRCICDGAATLRSEDLVKWGVVSLTKSGCHASVLCPSGYSSCASWSGPSNCDGSYCQDESWCGNPWCDTGCDPNGGPANHTPYEQFRVCFDQFGNSCTEWVSYDAVFCGC
jgi:hypothetical protein